MLLAPTVVQAQAVALVAVAARALVLVVLAPWAALATQP